MDDKPKTSVSDLFDSFEEEERERLMAKHLKDRLDKMCMHPHQRDSAASLTLALHQRKMVN